MLHVVFVFVGQGACVDEWPRIFDLLLRMKSGEAPENGNGLNEATFHIA